MKLTAFVLIVVALAAACGGDSTGPGKHAASVTAVAGDSQLAPTGAPFDFPLSFVTLDGNGQPVAGVHVAWSVSPAGSAILNPTSSVSDGNGQVSTAVTAGSLDQEITITASVPGVSTPVTFSALIMDPCTYVKGISIGQTLNGRLASTDCHVIIPQAGTWYYDFFAFGLPVGQQSIRISMTGTVPAESLDTYIDLYTTTGPLIAFDDDQTLIQNTNSQLDIILPGDTYIIGANSYAPQATGAYSMKLESRPPAMNGCRQVWVLDGGSVSDSLSAADCVDASLMIGSFDVARVILRDSTTLSVVSQSAAINPSLSLYRVRGSTSQGTWVRTFVASNDSTTTTKAYLSYHVPNDSGAIYDVMLGSTTSGQVGAYSFTVGIAPPSSRFVPAPAPGLGSRSWWRSAGASLRLSKP